MQLIPLLALQKDEPIEVILKSLALEATGLSGAVLFHPVGHSLTFGYMTQISTSL